MKMQSKHRRWLTALLALAAVSVVAVTTSALASTTSTPCDGLACPGVLPASSSAYDPSIPSVSDPRDLSKQQTSGFYAYGDAAGRRAVAYVVAPGSWATAPSEVKALPLANDLLPAEKTSKWVVIYGPGEMASGPWASTTSATIASVGKRKSAGPKAHTAAASDCVSPWFCVFTSTNFSGTKCQWQDTGIWQTMPTDCINNAESMVNRRNGWSLLKRTSDNANYCAQPNSQDSTLSNNGFSNNTYETYNSTSTAKLAAWNCAN